MKSNPLVSVLVATYNQVKVIEDTIKSILEQTYLNIEIVISDDCSKDGTSEILVQLAQKNSAIKLFLQEKNLGITNNYNFLASNATGKYVSIFSGDDVMFSEKIQKQVELLEENPDASFCHHAVIILDAANNKPRELISHRYANGTTTIHDVLRNLGIPGSMAIMYRKDMACTPVFDPTLHTACDWLQMIHLCMAGRGVYIEEPLCYYRKDAGYNGKDPTKYEDDFLSTISIARATYAITGNTIDKSCDYALARFSLGAGYRRLLIGDKFKARQFFKTAMSDNKLFLNAFFLNLMTLLPVPSKMLVFGKKIYKEIVK